MTASAEPSSSATTSVAQDSLTLTTPPIDTDIGMYMSPNNTVPDHLRYSLLTNPWTPPDDYSFPVVLESGKKRKFQSSWLQRFPWLVYSAEKAGGFCKFCVLFAPEAVRNQKLGRLVSGPLNRYKDAIEYFTQHEVADYHKESMMRADQFLLRWRTPSGDIVNAIDSSRAKQVQENRRRMLPVIKTVMFCGRQELPLRGHRDAGPLVVD